MSDIKKNRKEIRQKVKMGAAFIKGARDQGLVLTVKHFALNEQESNRATEQAMREIYLKAFEISIKEGKPYGVMTALNCVGPDWSSASKALVTNLLREEWGYLGFVTGDATTSAIGGYASVIDSLMAGNDATLSMFNTDSTIKTLKDGVRKRAGIHNIPDAAGHAQHWLHDPADRRGQ
jgi:beta-glucosidase